MAAVARSFEVRLDDSDNGRSSNLLLRPFFLAAGRAFFRPAEQSGVRRKKTDRFALSYCGRRIRPSEEAGI